MGGIGGLHPTISFLAGDSYQPGAHGVKRDIAMGGPITEMADAVFVAAMHSAPIGVNQNIYLSIILREITRRNGFIEYDLLIILHS